MDRRAGSLELIFLSVRQILFASLLLVFGAIPVWADGFLSKSRLLGSAGVEIIPAQQSKDGLILPVLQSDRVEPKTFLSSDGAYPITKASSEKKRKLNVRTCGADELATPWKSTRPIRGVGYFVAAGKGLDTLKVKWLAATKVKVATQAECLSYPGYKTTEVTVAKVESDSRKVFFAYFLSPEAIRWNSLYDREKENAFKIAPPNCEADFGLQRVGFLTNNKCDVLLESKIDCEGQGYKRGSFGKPLGILEISKGHETERWLVFKAAGYEGDAFLGISLSADRPVADKDIDLYVYSGC